MRLSLSGWGTLSSSSSSSSSSRLFTTSPRRSWLWESSRKPNWEFPSETQTHRCRYIKVIYVGMFNSLHLSIGRGCERSSYPQTECSVLWNQLQTPCPRPLVNTWKNKTTRVINTPSLSAITQQNTRVHTYFFLFGGGQMFRTWLSSWNAELGSAAMRVPGSAWLLLWELSDWLSVWEFRLPSGEEISS